MDHITILGTVKTMFRSEKNLNIHRLLQPGPAHWCHHCHHHHCCQVPLPQCSPHLHYHHLEDLEDHLPVIQQEGDYHHQLPGEGQWPHPTLLPGPAVHKIVADVWTL